MTADGSRRYLIAVGITTGLATSGPQIVASVGEMAQTLRRDFGYERVTTLDIDPPAEQIRKEIREFCLGCGPDDTVALYYTGHADEVNEKHRVWTGDTVDPVSETLETGHLAELMMVRTPLRNALIIIDTCFAGKGGAEALRSSVGSMGDGDGKTLALLTAAYPREQIVAGDFARLFASAVRRPAVVGHEPPFLALGAITSVIDGDPTRPGWQTVSHSVLFGKTDGLPFFPNPRHNPQLSGLDLLTQLRIEQQELRLADLRGHFLPRARGVDVQTQTGWRFVGREMALRDLAGWLQDPEDRSPRVVTGGPGSGKSAVIGRLVVLSDPDYRRTVPVQGVARGTSPPEGSIATAVHARGLTSAQVLAAIGAKAGVTADTPADLLREIRGRRLTVAVDAVDEALDPEGLASGVLRPLAEAGPAGGLRLLLGTRPHLLGSLGLAGPGSVVDLDDERYSDPESIHQYVLQWLQSAEGPPYASAAPGVVADIARAVADAAGHSFLVALIVTRTLLSQPWVPDPADREWRAGLPGTAAEAMHADLETRLGPDADRARDLLRPLAFAFGAGLPWENLWAPLASRLSGRPYTDEDLIWLRRQAGSYVVEASQSDRSVYRLYHAALAEYLRHGREEAAVHQAFATFLTGRVPEAQSPDWSRAHPYTLAHLATHAQRAGLLEDLLQDPGYLVNATPAALLAALPTASTPAARDAGAAYQRAVHQFRNQPEQQRASYLEFAARIARAPALAAQVGAGFPERRWSIPWTHWPPEYPHQVLGGNLGLLTGVLLVSSAGEAPVVVSIGADARLRTWDPVAAEPIGAYAVGDAPLVMAKSVRLPGRRAVIVMLAADGRLYFWDLTRAELLTTISVIPAWRRRISAFYSVDFTLLECVSVPGGRSFAFVGVQGSGISVWEVPSGRPVAVLPPWGDAEVGWVQTESGRVVLLARTAAEEYWAYDVEGLRGLSVDVDPGRRASLVLGSGERAAIAPGRFPDEPDPRDSGLRLVGDLGAAQPGPDEPPRLAATLSGRFLRVEVTDVAADRNLTWTATLSGHTGDVTSYDFGRVGEADVVVTASEDGTVRRWDVGLARTGLSLSLLAPSGVIAVSRVVSTRLDDGTSAGLASDADGNAALWDLRSGEFVRGLSDDHWVSAVAVARLDGEPLAVIASLQAVEVVRLPGGDTARRLGGRMGWPNLWWPNEIACVPLPGGGVAAVTAGHRRRVGVWDLGTGKLARVLGGHRGWSSCVTQVRATTTRALVLTGGFDNRVNVWDLGRRWHRRFRIVAPLAFLRRPSSGLARSIRAVRLPGGATLVLAVTVDGMVRALRASDSMRRPRRIGAMAAEIVTTAELTNGLPVVITVAGGIVRVWEATTFPPAAGSAALCEINVDVPVSDIDVTDDDIVVLATPNGLTAVQLGARALAERAGQAAGVS